MTGLKIVLDEWARPEPFPDEVPVMLAPAESFVLARHLDAMLTAIVARPGPLVLVTGI
jgi:hypothetical protein